jgi:hypothetical protein
MKEKNKKNEDTLFIVMEGICIMTSNICEHEQNILCNLYENRKSFGSLHIGRFT